MKKIIIMTFFMFLVFVSCVDIKAEINEKSNQIIQGVCKNDSSYINPLVGVIFDKKNIDITTLINRDIEIVDYEMKSIVKSNEIWEVLYTVMTESEPFDIKIKWQMQPKEWLLSDIKILNSDDVTSYMSDELIVQVNAICESLINGEYRELYNFMSDDFGKLAGYKISSADALAEYLRFEFSFFQPRFDTFKISHWSKITVSGDDEIIVKFNEEQSDSFRLAINLDNNLKLTGLYCIEFEHAKEGVIAQLSLNDVEDYYHGEEINKAYHTNNKEHIESADLYAAYVYEYLASDNYKMLYIMMDDLVRRQLSFNEFTRYITLMRKRSFTENLDVYLGGMLDININYDETTYMMSSNGYVKDSFKHTILPKDNAKLKHGFNAYIELNQEVMVDDDPDSISNDLIGLILNSASLYEINPEYFLTLSENEQMSYYIPLLSGSSLEHTEQENHDIRLKKSFELIRALKAKNFEALWAIESYHTGFESIEEFKEYYELQVKLIGSFNSIYLPIQGYKYLMTGQFIVEFAFVDQNDQLSKLLIAFDSDNKILSYDVMNVKRRSNEESD